MLLIRVCQWSKLQIQLITKDPVEVIRAGFRKSDKPSSKIPGMFKGQLFIFFIPFFFRYATSVKHSGFSLGFTRKL